MLPSPAMDPIEEVRPINAAAGWVLPLVIVRST